MVAIHVNQEAATYAFDVVQHGRYTVDREVFEQLAHAGLPRFHWWVQEDGGVEGQTVPPRKGRFPGAVETWCLVNRVPIAELPSTWPANAIREKALEGGRIFLRDMRAQGLEPLTELEGLVVLGPYRYRRFDMQRPVSMLRSYADSAAYVIADREPDDDDSDPGAADFILEGHFLERRGRIIEYDDHKGN